MAAVGLLVACSGPKTTTEVACGSAQLLAGQTLSRAFAETISFAHGPSDANKGIGRNLPDVASDAVGIGRIGSGVAGAPIPGGYDYGFTAFLHGPGGSITCTGSVSTDGSTVKIDVDLESSDPAKFTTHGQFAVGASTLSGSLTSTGTGDPYSDPTPSNLTMRADLQSEAGCVTGGTVDIDAKRGDEDPRHIRFRWSGCDVVTCD